MSLLGIRCRSFAGKMALTGVFVTIFGLGAVFLIAQYVFSYLRSPLKAIPGPFLAKFSNIWRFINHYQRKHIETQRKLHEQYGDVVRLGPTTVSIANPSLIRAIYNTRGTFLKVCWMCHISLAIPYANTNLERLLQVYWRSLSPPKRN